MAWPRELAEEWRLGLARCRGSGFDLRPALPGAPPACTEVLARRLWDGFVAAQAPGRVFILTVSEDAQRPVALVSGETYRPAHPERIVAEARAPPVGLAGAIGEVVRALAQKTGRRVPRAWPAPGTSPPPGADPFAGDAVATDAVAGQATCDRLPARLAVRPASVLARSIATRWAASASGSAPTASCGLEVSEQPDGDSLLAGMPVIVAVLTCGGHVATADALRFGLSARQAPVVARLSERLVTAMSLRYCPTPP